MSSAIGASFETSASSHVCVALAQTRPLGQTPSGHGAPGLGFGEKHAAHDATMIHPAALIGLF
jgi:hypothetical protein